MLALGVVDPAVAIPLLPSEATVPPLAIAKFVELLQMTLLKTGMGEPAATLNAVSLGPTTYPC
jgi:hypothetical protein